MKHRILCSLFFLMAVRWMMIPMVFAQPEPSTENSTNINCEALVFESNHLDHARLGIYLQVPYNEISFVNEDREYIGRYEIFASLQDSTQQQVWQQDQSVELHAKDFSQTISSRLSSAKQFSVLLDSGQYSLQVQIIDQESKKSTAFKRSVIVNSFLHRPLVLSDILLVDRVSKEGAHTNIIPNLTGVVSRIGERAYLYFEIYSRAKLDSVTLSLYALNEKRDTVLRQEKTMMLNGMFTQSIWELQDSLLPVSQTTLVINAQSFQRDSTGNPLHAKALRNILVHLKNLPPSINDLDKAIEQLQYIAKGSEIDSIRDASTVAEKENRFLEFWQKHNPNPATQTNSLMEEYYARVAYANKHFSHLGDGWKTDMGMVFVLSRCTGKHRTASV